MKNAFKRFESQQLETSNLSALFILTGYEKKNVGNNSSIIYPSTFFYDTMRRNYFRSLFLLSF